MSVRILHGDCRDVLKTLPDQSVHCVVTSPPYWGLRDYGTAKWDGGNPQCDHQVPLARKGGNAIGTKQTTNPGSYGYREWLICGRCGARRIDSQLGLETSLGEYIETMVSVFREVRHVLRDDGTLWLNLGDSYNNRTKVRTTSHQPALNGFVDDNWAKRAARGGVRMSQLSDGIKEKDLCGIPWRVAFALQADGWWLRQDIIWAKPNPMPESVTDRCTKAHEYIFLLSKSARYFYDAEAIREEPTGRTDPIRHFGNGPHAQSHTPNYQLDGNVGRNKRSVWEVATAPFSEAHFATFPPALIEPCILAGCPEKCCAECGAPWLRQVERPKPPASVFTKRNAPIDGMVYSGSIHEGEWKGHGQKLQNWLNENPPKTIGFSPSCTCNAVVVPGTILDPFGGAGTTGLVADRLSRNAILIELNPEYAAMAERRITDDAPLFAEVF